MFSDSRIQCPGRGHSSICLAYVAERICWWFFIQPAGWIKTRSNLSFFFLCVCFNTWSLDFFFFFFHTYKGKVCFWISQNSHGLFLYNRILWTQFKLFLIGGALPGCHKKILIPCNIICPPCVVTNCSHWRAPFFRVHKKKAVSILTTKCVSHQLDLTGILCDGGGSKNILAHSNQLWKVWIWLASIGHTPPPLFPLRSLPISPVTRMSSFSCQ